MNDYQRGAKDAWELARRIFSYDDDCYKSIELEEIFGTTDMDAIMRTPYDEVKEKIEKWNNREQYKVGDIIRHGGTKAFVTAVHCGIVNYVEENGETGKFIANDHMIDWKVIGSVDVISYSKEVNVWI